MMSESLLQKLEWGLLTEKLALYCQSPEAAERSRAKRPVLEASDILKRWEQARPMTDLYRQGYRAPIGELDPVAPLVKAVGLGQVLDGLQLRAVLRLLVAVKKVYAFAQDFSPKCETLQGFKGRLILLSPLLKSIEKAVDEDGALLDQASPELSRIRNQQRGLKKKIEQKLKQVLNDSSWDLYLQDDFFTTRAERYVVPVKLDGRGRVPGSIVDTSESGQTLFIEPAVIGPMNQALQDLELSEKLEIIKILKGLSQKVCEGGDALLSNYEELIFLDELSAEGQMACELDAVPVRLCEQPRICLKNARHPLVRSPSGGGAIPNQISLDQDHHVLIISGPNAGGKTVVLKTLGMLVLMAKAGLQIPADGDSELFLFDRIFIEMGDAQSLTASLSTFSGHIQGLKPIVETAGAQDLILLDELAVGTEPNTGAAIAQAILEHLASLKAKALVTTHYDNLKSLAVKNKAFRNASMEYSLVNYKPTYKLILDVPGQSYGLELASQIGLPESLIARAKTLRGASVSALDDAVGQLMKARDQARQAEEEMLQARKEAEAGKARWDHDVMLLERNRKKSLEAMKLKFEKDLSKFRQDFDNWQSDVKKIRKELQKGTLSPDALSEKLAQGKQHGKSLLKSGEDASRQLTGRQESEGSKKAEVPGRLVDFSVLKVSDLVWVTPMARSGKILKLGQSKQDKIEVEAGAMKLRVDFKDLRLISTSVTSIKPAKKTSPTSKKSSGGGSATPAREDTVIFQTSGNTVDLRGMEVADALEKTWRFLDAGVMRGEPALILIHGHGTDTLKSSIRKALRNECPYDISYQSGDRSQGGDGVTVVIFEK